MIMTRWARNIYDEKESMRFKLLSEESEISGDEERNANQALFQRKDFYGKTPYRGTGEHLIDHETSYM